MTNVIRRRLGCGVDGDIVPFGSADGTLPRSKSRPYARFRSVLFERGFVIFIR